MHLKLHVWRQPQGSDKGRFVEYEARDISEHASFLEMLDLINERLIERGEEPIAFEHDCREGICGSCGMMVNGVPHGPHHGIATCQLHMRSFHDGDEIWVEPWRASAFPVDISTDRPMISSAWENSRILSRRSSRSSPRRIMLRPNRQRASASFGFASIFFRRRETLLSRFPFSCLWK